MPSKSGEHKVKVAPKGESYDENYEKIFRKGEVKEAEDGADPQVPNLRGVRNEG